MRIVRRLPVLAAQSRMAVAILLGGLLFVPGCSVRAIAVNALDDEPELVAAAVPFGLKTIEALIEEAPLGAAFGINPVHLGVIFLANLDLGFLFPPLGLNLILASSRFRTPLPRIYATVVPFLLILGAGVVLITYFPQLSLAAGDVLGAR